MARNIGGKMMQIRRARHTGFNALRGGSRFFVTESAAVSDRRHARRNFQFPNLLEEPGHSKVVSLQLLRSSKLTEISFAPGKHNNASQMTSQIKP